MSTPLLLDTELHKLLRRQLRRYPLTDSLDNIQELLNAVSNAYSQMDMDKAILERTLVLTSEELNAKNSEYRRSNEELSKFANVVSHDLQEPLRSIQGYVQLFVRRYKDKVDDDGQVFLQGALSGVQRLQNFISDLLQYSRAGQRLQNTATDMQLVVSSIVEDLHQAIADADASIVVHCLPTVVVDRRAIAQVFLNLIANAIKFRDGKRPLQIEVSCRQAPSFHEFSVRDNGCGVPNGQAKRIFEMFQSAHSREQYAGTGMGLAIAAKLSECMGGKLYVDEGVAQGACFVLQLPRQP